MMASGSNFLGLYGQSPRQAAALYTDARDSMRHATSISSSSKRRSMQPPPRSTPSNISYDQMYEAPHCPTGPENTNTPPPPYSCRASVLPETLPAASRGTSYMPESPSSASASSNSPPPSSRAQKRRSSLMIKEIGMRILYAK